MTKIQIGIIAIVIKLLLLTRNVRLLVIEYCNLRFICLLVLDIWNLIASQNPSIQKAIILVRHSQIPVWDYLQSPKRRDIINII